MSDLTKEFAVNCTPGATPNLPRYAATYKAKDHISSMLNGVRAAHIAGKRKRMNYLSKLYLNSYDARLAATEMARRAMKRGHLLPKALVPSIASSLNPLNGSTEEVRVNLIPKGDDPLDRRVTMSFGAENRALQYLALGLLETVANLHPRQFGTGNGGIHAAIKHVAQAMKEGFVWAVEIDIENCFPSFDGNKVPDLLPLPKEVTERVLLARNLNLVPGNLLDLFEGVTGGVHGGVPRGGPHTSYVGPAGGLGILTAEVLAEARWGFPQGSAASSLLAEMLLAPVLQQLPTGGKVFGYVDNFLVMAKSENDAVSITKALESALKAHFAGPLRPKIKRRFHPGEPIEFLGHRLAVQHGTVMIQPSPLNLQRFEVEMKTELSGIKSHSPGAQVKKLNELKTYVRSWTAAFALWPLAETYKKQWLAKIANCS
jgi:hypothetical protein